MAFARLIQENQRTNGNGPVSYGRGRRLVVPAAVAGQRHDPPVVAADLECGRVGVAAQRSGEDGEEERERTEVRHRALAAV